MGIFDRPTGPALKALLDRGKALEDAQRKAVLEAVKRGEDEHKRRVRKERRRMTPVPTISPRDWLIV